MNKNLSPQEAIESPFFSHARQGKGLWRNIVFIYHRDPNSPSGVILASSGESVIVDPLLRVKRSTSALSPSER